MLSPEYTCEVELEVCKSNNFKLLDPNDNAQKLLSKKPEYLRQDNFQNLMYQKIAADKTPRKTLSFV